LRFNPCHIEYLLQHCVFFSFDQEPAWQLRSNPCHREFVLYPSALSAVHYPYAHSLGQQWDPRHKAIYYYTGFPLDLELTTMVVHMTKTNTATLLGFHQT
jgi:hypothetical protein